MSIFIQLASILVAALIGSFIGMVLAMKAVDLWFDWKDRQ